MEIYLADQLLDFFICVTIGCVGAILFVGLCAAARILGIAWAVNGISVVICTVLLAAMLVTVWCAGDGLLRGYMIVGTVIGFATVGFTAGRRVSASVDRMTRRSILCRSRKSERK